MKGLKLLVGRGVSDECISAFKIEFGPEFAVL